MSWFSLSPHIPGGESASKYRARQKNDRKEHEYVRECVAKATKSIGYQHGPNSRLTPVFVSLRLGRYAGIAWNADLDQCHEMRRPVAAAPGATK